MAIVGNPADPTPPRPARAARPRDAATLVLLRDIGGRPHVLMGQRHARHRFLPDQYVFPGGRIDRADHYVEPAAALPRRVAAVLERSGASPRRAQALALAAVRETFEETGLIIGRPIAKPPRRAPASWRPFFAAGFGPALDGLDYICRAVTPPYRPIRFDARFFLADGARVAGELGGSGELLALDWMPIGRAKALPLPRITRIVLDNLEAMLAAPGGVRGEAPVPVYRYLHGRHTVGAD